MNLFSPNLTNLRHLAILTHLAEGHGVHAVARLMNVSQPAVTLALTKMEVQFGAKLFERSLGKGLTITPHGQTLQRRARRLIARLEAGVIEALRFGSAGEIGEEVVERSRYIVRRLSTRKVQSMAALMNSPNSQIAAERLGITQASLRRLIGDVQAVVGVQLLSDDRNMIRFTGAGIPFATTCSLALREIEAGYQDLRELSGEGSGGTVAIGSTMAPTVELLPRVLLELNRQRPRSTAHVVFASISTMVGSLQSGELDVVCSTDRPEMLEDIEAVELFTSHIRIYARAGHPLAGMSNPSIAELARYSWITPGAQTVPGRRLQEIFEREGQNPPNVIVETLVQELACLLLLASDHLLIWAGAGSSSILNSGLVEIDRTIPASDRPVWLLHRKDWEPTAVQRLFLELVLKDAREIG